jgi:hypothetical protein
MRASASDIGLLGAVGIFVALGVGFYWIMQPAVFENAGVASYKPPPATIVVYPEVPFVPPTPAPSASMSPPPPSASRSSAAIEPPVEAAFAAAIPEVQEKPALAVPKQTPKRRERTTSRKESHTSRQEPHTSSARNASASPYEFRSVW